MSVRSFNAVCDASTRTLVLGTMPGIASIDSFEYYAHKRNAFWAIMLAMLTDVPASFDLPPLLDYPTRIAKLKSGGIGLWDVLAECERQGSLDSAIKSDSIVVNDFVALLTQYPLINTIAFNGKAAQKLFNRHALPRLEEHGINTDAIRWLELPSSSPAMASLNLEQKYETWHSRLQR